EAGTETVYNALSGQGWAINPFSLTAGAHEGVSSLAGHGIVHGIDHTLGLPTITLGTPSVTIAEAVRAHTGPITEQVLADIANGRGPATYALAGLGPGGLGLPHTHLAHLVA